MEVVMRHEFTGNARELENLIEYAFVLCRNGLIDVNHLREHLQAKAQRTMVAEQGEPVSPLRQSEPNTIRLALSRTDGHLGRAAGELGISRTTLWRKMKRYGIEAKATSGPVRPATSLVQQGFAVAVVRGPAPTRPFSVGRTAEGQPQTGREHPP